MRSIFRKFGKDIKINYLGKTIIRNREGKEIITEKEKTARLYNWKDCLQIIRKVLVNVREKKKKGKSQIAYQ